MISDASVLVSCDGDGCGHKEERFLTALVSNSWDERDLRPRLKKDGWKFTDDSHLLCPDCAEEARND